MHNKASRSLCNANSRRREKWCIHTMICTEIMFRLHKIYLVWNSMKLQTNFSSKLCKFWGHHIKASHKLICYFEQSLLRLQANVAKTSKEQARLWSYLHLRDTSYPKVEFNYDLLKKLRRHPDPAIKENALNFSGNKLANGGGWQFRLFYSRGKGSECFNRES